MKIEAEVVGMLMLMQHPEKNIAILHPWCNRVEKGENIRILGVIGACIDSVYQAQFFFTVPIKRKTETWERPP